MFGQQAWSATIPRLFQLTLSCRSIGIHLLLSLLMACKCIGIHPDTLALELLFQDVAAPVDASIAKPVYQAPESHKPIMNIADRANMQVWLQTDSQTAVPLSH